MGSGWESFSFIQLIVLLKFICKYEVHVPLIWIASYLVCLIICECIIVSGIGNLHLLVFSSQLQVPNYINGAPGSRAVHNSHGYMVQPW